MELMSGIALGLGVVVLVSTGVILSLNRRSRQLGGATDVIGALDRLEERLERSSADDAARGRREAAEATARLREELLARLAETHRLASDDGRQARTELLANLATGTKNASDSLQSLKEDLLRRVHEMHSTYERRMEQLRTTVDGQLNTMRTDNSQRLEEMRRTVAEKLEGTLERRLGESFRLVSERLEQVHKGLGEMQTLAVGVGDLKKVMANVKVRGTWGEIQLGSLLEQVLSPEQFARNVRTNPQGADHVEYAIKMPGRDVTEAGYVWLPIDAKFPIETYQRLVDAQERADPESCESEGKQLEVYIRGAARDIAQKYIAPPGTTDFAVMYLPTEGLFAEVIRRSGIVEQIQRENKVVIAGPTTLTALLNSLQMGFRTLAIQRRSSEVWEVLGAVKAEFGKFDEILRKVEKKLHEAGHVIEGASVRTRAIGRKLRNVQELPSDEAGRLLGLPSEAPREET